MAQKLYSFDIPNPRDGPARLPPRGLCDAVVIPQPKYELPQHQRGRRIRTLGFTPTLSNEAPRMSTVFSSFATNQGPSGLARVLAEDPDDREIFLTDLREIKLHVVWPGYDDYGATATIPQFKELPSIERRAMLLFYISTTYARVFEDMYRQRIKGKNPTFCLASRSPAQWLDHLSVVSLRHCGGDVFQADIVYAP
ncbi:hypothetical protein C8Q77DRAFT_1158085 [Trametes polyzona]|nr:hypothetical protein C8Q77DRAFT_1158085 [Trametes polyzona]